VDQRYDFCSEESSPVQVSTFEQANILFLEADSTVHAFFYQLRDAINKQFTSLCMAKKILELERLLVAEETLVANARLKVADAAEAKEQTGTSRATAKAATKTHNILELQRRIRCPRKMQPAKIRAGQNDRRGSGEGEWRR
jgi:hypothetical protein